MPNSWNTAEVIKLVATMIKAYFLDRRYDTRVFKLLRQKLVMVRPCILKILQESSVGYTYPGAYRESGFIWSVR